MKNNEKQQEEKSSNPLVHTISNDTSQVVYISTPCRSQCLGHSKSGGVVPFAIVDHDGFTCDLVQQLKSYITQCAKKHRL